MPVVAMDTNAWMMPVECEVRVFDELDRLLGATELVSPEAVLAELRSFAGRGGAEGTAASVGADLADERATAVATDESNADDAIVELARDGRVDYVVTNDRPLRDRVLDAGVPVIALRGGTNLAVSEP